MKSDEWFRRYHTSNLKNIKIFKFFLIHKKTKNYIKPKRNFSLQCQNSRCFFSNCSFLLGTICHEIWEYCWVKKIRSSKLAQFLCLWHIKHFVISFIENHTQKRVLRGLKLGLKTIFRFWKRILDPWGLKCVILISDKRQRVWNIRRHINCANFENQIFYPVLQYSPFQIWYEIWYLA